MTVSGGEALGTCSVMNGISALIKETSQRSWAPFSTWGQSKRWKDGVYEEECVGPQQTPKYFPASRTIRN